MQLFFFFVAYSNCRSLVQKHLQHKINSLDSCLSGPRMCSCVPFFEKKVFHHTSSINLLRYYTRSYFSLLCAFQQKFKKKIISPFYLKSFFIDVSLWHHLKDNLGGTGSSLSHSALPSFLFF